ncbi:ImmA/IrrE family metallo-endopeptidase [uncultured Treponema sp.]|uniref:ImmA/IrrE family metallo-endopeptidase n=1 Tax=uncultured Treponema sp. TaxID=162155 RepID=UPI00338EFC85
MYFKSESKELYEKNGRYTVFYDETKPPAHSKFSILHELFHYESNHDLNAGEKKIQNFIISKNLRQISLPQKYLCQSQ